MTIYQAEWVPKVYRWWLQLINNQDYSAIQHLYAGNVEAGGSGRIWRKLNTLSVSGFLPQNNSYNVVKASPHEGIQAHKAYLNPSARIASP